MSEVKNRYDFVLVFDVKDGNPNGDPDAGNLPRIDPETGQGLVTDVCLKRKIRNHVLLTKCGMPKYDIYVKERAVLGEAQFGAFRELGIDTGKESEKLIPHELQSEFEDIVCDGLSIRSEEDEKQFLVVASDADKAEIKSWLKETEMSKKAKTLITDTLKDAHPRKPSASETDKGKSKMCETYYDVRTFGAVMSLKSAPNCGQVRGPVQLTFARSVDPIVTLEHSITRCAVATQEEAEKQSGDNRTMGRKNTVSYGLYVGYGFISPALASQTGFSQEDLDVLWDAMQNMFEHDHSAARGMMATCKLIVFKHDSPLGNAASHRLFDLVSICKNNNLDIPPRKFSDYSVTIDKANCPENVEIIEMV